MLFLGLSVAAAVISVLAFLAIKSADKQSSPSTSSSSSSSSRALTPKLPLRSQSGTVASVGSKAPNASSSSNSEAEKDKPKIDPEEDKEPGESLKETAPFATVRQVKGRRIVTFNFPTDALIGKIYSWNEDTGEEQIVNAKGRLTYNKGEWLCFIPSRIIAKYPQYLKRFQPGLLAGIRLNENSDSDQILEFCTIIPGIKYLELHRTNNLTSGCVASLNKFTELDEFDGYHSTVGGINLARATCWDKIEKFHYSHCLNVTPMLMKLKACKKLTLLDVHESNLTYQDYKAISELTNLRELKFESDRITLNELKLLANLPNLETIELYDCGLVEEAIPILRQFKALKTLRMGTQKTLVKLRDKFKAGLPGVEVE